MPTHPAPAGGQRLLVPPDVEAPVEPEVPLLLLVPAEPPVPVPVPVDGVVAVELPEAPMPEVVPEDDEPLGVAVLADPEGVDSEPVAEPPVAPMPDAVPEALPEAVLPQAASAAVKARGTRILIMRLLLC